jgi:glutaredoxin 3
VIKIYSTNWCGPCKNAKRLLDERGLSYDEIDIDEIGWNRDDLYDLTGSRTVPQIVIDEKPIGGYGDLLKLDREGKLAV